MSLTQIQRTFVLIQDHFLLQVNSNITRYSANSTDSGNILDLVLTNNEHLVSDVSVHPESFNSDHLPLSFAINAKFRRQKNVNREVCCYKKADFDGLRSTLNHIPWDSVILLSDVNDSVTKFQDLQDQLSPIKIDLLLNLSTRLLSLMNFLVLCIVQIT